MKLLFIPRPTSDRFGTKFLMKMLINVSTKIMIKREECTIHINMLALFKQLNIHFFYDDENEIESGYKVLCKLINLLVRMQNGI